MHQQLHRSQETDRKHLGIIAKIPNNLNTIVPPLEATVHYIYTILDAIRSIDSSQVKWNNEGSFLNDSHKDLKADYVISIKTPVLNGSVGSVKSLSIRK